MLGKISALAALPLLCAIAGRLAECHRFLQVDDASLLQVLAAHPPRAAKTLDADVALVEGARASHQSLDASLAAAQTSTYSIMQALMQQPLSPDVLAWAKDAAAGTDTSDTAIWPELRSQVDAQNMWQLGLYRPRIYVISLEASVGRRQMFAREFAAQGILAEEVRWLPAINGSTVPSSLRNPNGEAATGTEKELNTKLGVLGCYLSHMAAYQHSLAECPECDIVVLEDDVVFHPDFRNQWSSFAANLPEEVVIEQSKKPVAVLHFGGDAFWSPPYYRGQGFFVAGWVSRTWGYAIKAKELRFLVDHLKRIDQDMNVGIDQVLSGDVPFATLAPEQPLVRQASSVSYSSDPQDASVDEMLSVAEIWNGNCWTVTYEADQHCFND